MIPAALHPGGDDIHHEERSRQDKRDDERETALALLLFAEIGPKEDRAAIIVHRYRVIQADLVIRKHEWCVALGEFERFAITLIGRKNCPVGPQDGPLDNVLL